MVMQKLIHPYQSAFIRGRYLHDNVSLLQEIQREEKVNKQQGVVVKIDFEKDYDKVDQNFLFDCCKQKGFSEHWLDLLKKTFINGTLRVKVNDEVGPYFGSFKCVKQGDPLAPTLFNIPAN